MQVKDIESRLLKLEDAEAIRGLKARYFFCCDRKDTQGMRACFADGKIHIDYGMIGTFDNADALVEVFKAIGCHDHMVEMHHGMNPQVEVLDAGNARGTWSLHYFLIDTQAQRLTQLAGYYQDEYRKDNGVWKISRSCFTVTSTLAMDLADGNAKPLFAGRTMPAP